MDSHLNSDNSGIYPLYNPQQLNDNTQKTGHLPPFRATALLLLSAFGYLLLYAAPIFSLYFTLDLFFSFSGELLYTDTTLITIKTLAIPGCLYISYYIYHLMPDLPVGRLSNHKEFPELFKLVNSICDEYGYTELDHIKISRRFEIATIKTPRNGFLTRFNNTLVIGLPLMQSITQNQLKLAISHEIFKLSGYLKRSTSFIYYTHENWQQLNTANQLNTRHTKTLPGFFMTWYALSYDFLSRPARRHENLNADSHIHASTHDHSFSKLLLTLLISRNYLQQIFWPQLYSNAYMHATPPYLPYSSIESHLQQNLDKSQSRNWINIALRAHEEDTALPSLKTRLINLSCDEIKVPPEVKHSSAAALINSKLNEITQTMDSLWLNRHQEEWETKYKKGLVERKKLKELAIQARHGLLSDIKAWEYIQLIKLYIDKKKAISLYLQILKINIRDPRISFDIGRSLLESMVESGVMALERTVQLDSRYSVSCYQLIARYYTGIGNNKLAQSYRRKTLVHQLEVA
ncbi:MAG: hypothetical protein OEY89_03210 [Gammaproteobacteria bacterium]|nr:hypothetical protein [Gammaproteobacteria bacterium]